MAIRASLLGSFELSVDGRPIHPDAFARPSGLRLLKLLLVTPGHRIAREAAAELLWPEAEAEHSRVRLRKALHFARRASWPSMCSAVGTRPARSIAM